MLIADISKSAKTRLVTLDEQVQKRWTSQFAVIFPVVLHLLLLGPELLTSWKEWWAFEWDGADSIG